MAVIHPRPFLIACAVAGAGIAIVLRRRITEGRAQGRPESELGTYQTGLMLATVGVIIAVGRMLTGS